MPSPPYEAMKFIEKQKAVGNYVDQTPLFGLDDSVIKGAFYTGCAILWDLHGTKPVTIEAAHRHDWPEVLIFAGTQKDNPRDLGGEIEFWIEDEKYLLTKSSLIYAPGGVVHGPMLINRIDSPIGFFTAGTGSSYGREWEEPNPIA